MKTKVLLASLLLALGSLGSFVQKALPRNLGQPILTDTLSTLFFPVRYNEELLTTNKIAYLGDYYANLLVYNYQTDTYAKLFERDTYIEAFRTVSVYAYGPRGSEKIKNVTAKWVFMLVKFKDTNESGRLDEKDPSVLFAATTRGENLKQRTNVTENVVAFDIYDQQGFMLLKIQRDTDQDGSFRPEDKAFYYRKINLNDLSAGRAIEVNQPVPNRYLCCQPRLMGKTGPIRTE